MSEVKLPVEWAQQKGTNWKIACLAASVAGWDPQQDEGGLQVDESTYDAAIAAAMAKLDECRNAANKLPDSTSANRVFIINHHNAMAALVAIKPNITEVLAQIAMERESEDSQSLKLEKLAHFLWSRVLFPEAAGKAQIMNEWPIDYTVNYPNLFMESLRTSPVDVRKKHMR